MDRIDPNLCISAIKSEYAGTSEVRFSVDAIGNILVKVRAPLWDGREKDGDVEFIAAVVPGTLKVFRGPDMMVRRDVDPECGF
jgi:hypothetical protein